MMSIRQKINGAMMIIVLLASTSIVLFSWRKSSAELFAAVEKGNLSLAHATASDIFNINDREFKMLETLANLDEIRLIENTKETMHDKWRLINSATGGNKKYLGMAIYDEKGIGWTTTEKWSDLHEREYLARSMTGIKAIMDPNWSPVNGNLSTFYALPFRDKNAKQIGEVVAVLDSTDLCRTVASINVGLNSHPSVINMKTGKYVAHADEQIVKDGKSITDNAGDSFKAVIARIQKGETGTASFFDETARQKMSVAFQPIPDSDWAVVCMAPYSDFFNGISQLLVNMIVIAVISLIVAFAVGLFVVNIAIRPLNHVSSAIDGIASGDADLTRRLDVHGKDEIAQLATGFNFFTEKLHTIITELKGSKDDLNSYGERLGNMVQDNANFLDAMVSSIKDVNTEIYNQHDKVNSSVAAVGEISESVEQLRDLIQKQISSVEQASSAVTQMISNIGSVTSSTEHLAQDYTNFQNDVGKGILQQQEVSRKIQLIVEQSKMLNEANKAISTIASQTNLLAMNAAIEAAHAGDAGNGFAVVSDEIRKLSETSANESKKIASQLKDIRSSIEGVLQAAELSDKFFSVVAGKLKGTGDLVLEIKSSMEEQREGSKQINDALGEMNNATAQVRSASEDVDKSRQGIIGDVNSLKQSSDQVKTQVENMEENIKKLEQEDDSLLNIATAINGSIYRIGNQIDQFKV
mgnify:CR=1 FL=1